LAIIATRATRIARAAALVPALAAATYYAYSGLTLSHYDAKAHLVVARRIFDSLTPGWHQIGAVWLPLPHLLNAVPVQLDACYRSGFSGVALSVTSFVVMSGATAALVARATGSIVGALVAVALADLNPNVLYLQSTPMTEPLLFALVLVAVERLSRWAEMPSNAHARQAGIALGAACWTRYEAWPVGAAALAMTAVARFLRGGQRGNVLRGIFRIAAWPAGFVIVFLVLSRATVGEWFVAGGFFVPENPALGRPLAAARQVLNGVVSLGGVPLVVAGVAGATSAAAVALRRRDDRSPALLLSLAPLAAAALPFYAFVQGHPYRVRYNIALVVAAAVLGGVLVGLLHRRWPRAGTALGVGLVVAVVAGHPPLEADAPMVREAQWDTAHRRGRSAVTAYLSREWDGQPIMASMGSLAHYMQETSRAGFRIKDYLHEGNGDLWKEALKRPHPHAAWILIEERAEGGDMLAALVRTNPVFLSGYARVAEGGGVALYRRTQNSESRIQNPE
jgi:hypothetical protein